MATMTAELTCVCGQPLEWLHTTHCPRCGVCVHTPAAENSGRS
jgi:hypothetical protein